MNIYNIKPTVSLLETQEGYPIGAKGRVEGYVFLDTGLTPHTEAVLVMEDGKFISVPLNVIKEEK